MFLQIKALYVPFKKGKEALMVLPFIKHLTYISVAQEVWQLAALGVVVWLPCSLCEQLCYTFQLASCCARNWGRGIMCVAMRCRAVRAGFF